eukprot:g11520.t1
MDTAVQQQQRDSAGELSTFPAQQTTKPHVSRTARELAEITAILRHITIPATTEQMELLEQQPWVELGLKDGMPMETAADYDDAVVPEPGASGGLRVRWPRLYRGPVHKNFTDPTKGLPVIMGEMTEDDRKKNKVVAPVTRFFVAHPDRLIKYNRPLDSSPLGEITFGKETEVSFDPQSNTIQLIQTSGKKVHAWEMHAPYQAHFEVWHAFLLSRHLALRSQDVRLVRCLETKAVAMCVFCVCQDVRLDVRLVRCLETKAVFWKPKEKDHRGTNTEPESAATPPTLTHVPSSTVYGADLKSPAKAPARQHKLLSKRPENKILTLNLSNQPLNYETANCLAVILREATVELNLQLQSAQLTAEHLNQLFLAISQNKLRRVHTLSLARNPQLAEVQSVYAGWSSCVSLKHLQLAHCRLQDEPFLRQAQDMKDKAVAVSCGELESLDLSHNCLSGAGFGALLWMLRACLQLKKLDVRHNPLGDPGLFALVAALPNFPQLTELHLADTQVSDDSVLALCSHLRQRPGRPGLRVLDLSKNNTLSSKSVAALTHLAATSPRLRTLLFATLSNSDNNNNNNTASAGSFHSSLLPASQSNPSTTGEREELPVEGLDASSLAALRLLTAFGTG